jgi:gas vesicle protein
MVKRFMLGVAVGATAMYFLDPAQGSVRRRQASAWWEEHGPQITRVSERTLQVATTQTGRVTGKIADEVKERVHQTRAS